MPRRTPPVPVGLSPAAVMSPGGLLYEHGFHGPTWARWRAVMRAGWGERLSVSEARLFAEISGGRTPPTRPVTELWAIVGRGGGKDSIASCIAVVAALKDYSAWLRPGQRATILVLACDREQASICRNYILGYFEDVPELVPLVEKVTEEGIWLRNRVEIIVGTNSHRWVRGRTIVCAILDEVAFYRDERSQTPDTELYAALQGALKRIPQSILVAISTPYKRFGLLYETWVRYFGKDDPDVLVVQGTTRQFNETYPQKLIDNELERDPDRAASERLAEWRSDLGDLFDRALIESAVDTGVRVRLPRGDLSYRMRVDSSGGKSDSFTACVVHTEGQTIVVDCLYEAKPPFDASVIIREVCELARRYNVSVVTGDGYAAQIVADAFKREGVLYRTVKEDKSEIYLSSVALWTSGRIRMVDDRRAVHQLVNLQRRPTASGRDKVEHPRDGHDDLSLVVCGAAVEAALDARGALVRVERLLKDGRGVVAPPVCDRLFSVVIVDDAGQTGVVYFARCRHAGVPLTVIGFDAGPMGEGLYLRTYLRMAELAAACRPLYSKLAIYCQPDMRDYAEQEIAAVLLPAWQRGERIWDVEVTAVLREVLTEQGKHRLAHLASGPIEAGWVKLTAEVVAKMAESPLAGELQFRSGDPVSGPLGLAGLVGIALTFENERTLRRAA